MARLATPFTDLAVCRSSLSDGSRSFWLASQFLPAALKNSACGLYAFCREADDLVDEGNDPARALVSLHHRLDAIYANEPYDSAVDRVLSHIVQDHDLPRTLLDALLEGFAWDNQGRRYQNLSEVYDYSARVAGTVGVMMAVLMGIRDERTLARAADLGVAMQLTNIARDVGEDAQNGRLYLPLDLMVRAGLDPDAFLANPVYSPSLASVIAELLEAAEQLYQRADHGIDQLPRSARGGIYSARLLYAAIGHRLAEMDYNSIDQRAVVPISSKIKLVLKAIRVPRAHPSIREQDPLDECQYLTQLAAAAAQPTESYLAASAPKAFYHRMTWMLDMIAHLDAQQPASSKQQRIE